VTSFQIGRYVAIPSPVFELELLLLTAMLLTLLLEVLLLLEFELELVVRYCCCCCCVARDAVRYDAATRVPNFFFIVFIMTQDLEINKHYEKREARTNQPESLVFPIVSMRSIQRVLQLYRHKTTSNINKTKEND
jgi:hypothetical protein